MNQLTDLIRALRPSQWVKNLFVLAPLVFGKALLNGPLVWRACATLAAFSLLSGAVYVLNDLTDRAADANHPTKRHRPIASGRVSPRAALALHAVCLLAALAAALSVDVRVAVVAAGYFALNVGYTRAFKHVPFLDVTCIAAGFLLRVLAGSAATGIVVSHWLILCTFLLALFLGLGKRKHELLLTGNDTPASRKVLALYRLEHLDATLYATAAVTGVCYTLYTVSGRTVHEFGTHRLAWTIPFIVFGLYRFLVLARDASRPESPTEAMVTDPPFLINMGLWTGCVLAVVYLWA